MCNFESYTGFIDYQGKFYPCEPTKHHIVAEQFLPENCPPVYIGSSGYCLFDTTFEVRTLSVQQVATLQAWCEYHKEDFDDVTSAISNHLPYRDE